MILQDFSDLLTPMLALGLRLYRNGKFIGQNSLCVYLQSFDLGLDLHYLGNIHEWKLDSILQNLDHELDV